MLVYQTTTSITNQSRKGNLEQNHCTTCQYLCSQYESRPGKELSSLIPNCVRCWVCFPEICTLIQHDNSQICMQSCVHIVCCHALIFFRENARSMMCEQDEQLITQLYNRDFCPTDAPYYYKFSFRKSLQNVIEFALARNLTWGEIRTIHQQSYCNEPAILLCIGILLGGSPFSSLYPPGFLLILRENGDNWRGLTLTAKQSNTLSINHDKSID